MSVATKIADDFPFPTFPQFPSIFPHRPLARLSWPISGNCCSHKHTLSHYHHGVGGPGRDADRRKKTGCRRRNVIKEHLAAEDRKRIRRPSESSCKGPGAATHTHTLHNTAYCSTLTHTHSLAEMPAEERRLVAEEGSYSKNTWMQKIARRIGWKRRAPVAGPFQLSRSCCTTGFGRWILAEKTGEEDRKRIVRWRPMLAATFVQDNYTKVSGV